jgi:hypothetical protein
MKVHRTNPGAQCETLMQACHSALCLTRCAEVRGGNPLVEELASANNGGGNGTTSLQGGLELILLVVDVGDVRAGEEGFAFVHREVPEQSSKGIFRALPI